MDGVIELNEVKLENIKLKSEIQVAYGHVRSQEVIAQSLKDRVALYKSANANNTTFFDYHLSLSYCDTSSNLANRF